MIRKTCVLAAVLSCIIAMLPVAVARADALFPQTIPVGDVPSATVRVLGNHAVTTPGLEDATLFVDLSTSLTAPQLIVKTGPEVTGCEAEYDGVISVTATGTSFGVSLFAAAFISGTRRDSDRRFEGGASDEVIVPLSSVLPTTEVLEVCVSPLLSELEPEPDPTPTPEETPTPDPTPAPEEAPTPDPTPAPEEAPTRTPDPTPAPEETPNPEESSTARAITLQASETAVAKGSSVVFSGVVTGPAGCVGGQAVALTGPAGGSARSHILGRTVTGEDGAWSLVLKVVKTKEYLAETLPEPSCAGARSSAVVVKAV